MCNLEFVIVISLEMAQDILQRHLEENITKEAMDTTF